MDENGSFLKSIFKGLIISAILTLVLLLGLSLVMTMFELSEKAYNISYLVITILSLVIGAVIAAKSNENKGWLTGGTVGLLFFVFIYMLGSIVTGSFSFELVQLYKIGQYFMVGTIAGILGVNL